MKTIRLLILCTALAFTYPARAAETVLRVGHFPNITHAQALVAHNFSRQGKGWFEERLVLLSVPQARDHLINAIGGRGTQRRPNLKRRTRTFKPFSG